MDRFAFAIVDADSAAARLAMRRYFDELDGRFEGGFDSDSALDVAGHSLNPPHGLFVIAGLPSEPMACGGLAFLDNERAEVKRMWVSPGERGRGLASSLLDYLEQLASASGRFTVVLDTNSTLTQAIALYQRRGYRPIERYNDNPYAQLWFAKSLPRSGTKRSP